MFGLQGALLRRACPKARPEFKAGWADLDSWCPFCGGWRLVHATQFWICALKNAPPFEQRGGVFLFTFAERRLGELLRDTERAKGTAGAGRPKIGSHRVLPPKREPTLADLGITKNESSRSQAMAKS